MIENRLRELRGELEKGMRQIEVLDRRRAELRDTMLRIEGAVQVLEELRTAESSGAAPERPVLARTS